jgi:beta-phosphoglucomutase-like phosphatase (HAD superfamily)
VSSLYHKAVANLGVFAADCLGVEATYPGIAAGQAAGLAMVGLATMFPFHMVQRRADWVVDRLVQIEWNRLQAWFATGMDRPQPLEAS